MKNGSVEYPALAGKIVKQVRFANDEEFTSLVIESMDNTHVSFRLQSRIELHMPEIATIKDGNIAAWRKLKSRSTGRCA